MIIATIAKLILAVAIGYYLFKKEIFTVELNQKLSYFILNICMPLLIITSLNGTQVRDRGQIFLYIFVGLAFYAVLPFIGKLFCRVAGIKQDERSVYEAFYIFSNNLFMGYPICASIYGNSCIFMVSMFNLGFNLLYYTYGTRLFEGKPETEQRLVQSLGQAVRNPGVASSLAAILLFFTGVQLPEGLVQVCSFVGDLASPLSLVVIGSVIGSYSVKKLLVADARLYVLSVIRLVVLPVVTYFIMTALGFDGIMLGVAVISMGMPVAAMVSMGCIKAGRNEELGAAGLVVTTILSILTIPVLLLFFG